jgi:hypothetical protein
MVKRAKSKHFGLPLATQLTEYAKQHAGMPQGELEQSYRNTIYCAGVQSQSNGMIRARYCSNRWCPVCGRIKMGKAINSYLPVVEEWDDPYFVTLTVENIYVEGDLHMLIEHMMGAFNAVKRKLHRDLGGLTALRKLECTYGKGYHPHFHVIVDGREAAYALRDQWLAFAPRYTGQRVELVAQDVQKANMVSLVELFKYATKLCVKGPAGVQYVSPKHLDVIFRALRNRRTYQSYGFKVAKDVEDVTDVESRVEAFTQVEERVLWLWDQDSADWIDHHTGELLTGSDALALPSEMDLPVSGPPYKSGTADVQVLSARVGAPAPTAVGRLPLRALSLTPFTEVGGEVGRPFPRP